MNHQTTQLSALSLSDYLLSYFKTKYKLTPKEVEVLTHISYGESNKVIARSLLSAEATVKFHVKKILKKMSLNSRNDAAIIFIRAKYAAQNKRPLPQEIALNIISNKYKLTPKQQQVAYLTACGVETKQAAESLNIKYDTIKLHKTTIFKKMKINSSVEITTIFQNTLHDAFYAHDHSSWFPQQ